MKSFLEHVADDILSKYGTDLSHIAIVFPNKRASLFLNDALANRAGHPLWSPAYTTISNLFTHHSQLQIADPIKLICDLHRCYTEVTGFDETLDHFYGWGQLLLADFDDIDKNLAPAEMVFANLRDLHELDSVSYLNAEQREAIRKFFSNFTDEHDTLLKERFLRLWSRMGDIYSRFNDMLRSQGLAYEGALYREVSENEELAFEYDRYLFVGFNFLQQAEQRLFTTLMHQGKAFFYWDFDHSYINTEAGHFIAQYLGKFPNELDANDNNIYRCAANSKTITFIAASTENIQARYVSTWATDKRIAAGRRAAVVLCNESLLPTVTHCLPDEVEQVNITTGYPLSLSPVSVLIQLLIQLQTIGYERQRNRFRLHYVNKVLKHPYITYISKTYNETLKSINDSRIYYPDRNTLSTDDGLALLFGRPVDNNLQMLQWLMDIMKRMGKAHISSSAPAGGELSEGLRGGRAEAVFRTYTMLNRLADLIEAGDLQIDVVTLQRLIVQISQQTAIPFHGEPAVGMQVMGMLETRNLDFDHLLMLSANEGNMPKGVADASFIPYSLRKAFGLTTTEHKVAIYAYYFYRLLARSTDITLVYNSATNDGQTGEMSRFMLQMLAECPHPIALRTFHLASHSSPQPHHPIEKTPAVIAALRQRFESRPCYRGAVRRTEEWEHQQQSPLLTPTAINRYMRCPLQFYYCYVEGLREPDDNDEDTIDNRIFGNIFHTAAQLLYERMSQKSLPCRRGAAPRTEGWEITAADIDYLFKNTAEIERCVDEAFHRELFHTPYSAPARGELSEGLRGGSQLNGLQIINREVIIHYLRLLLEADRRLVPFTIIALEADIATNHDIASLHITTTIGGRIDRLDMVTDNTGESRIRVIDYKTGARLPSPLRSTDAIFDSANLRNHSDYYLQALLYARLVSQQQPLLSGSVPATVTAPSASTVVGGFAADTTPARLPVAPALLFIQHNTGEHADPILKFGNERILDINSSDGERFEELLDKKIEEIFDPESPFTPTDDQKICAACPYTSFCGSRSPARGELSEGLRSGSLMLLLFLFLLPFKTHAQVFSIDTISDAVFSRMNGKSYKANCTVPRSELRYLILSHYDAKGNTKTGELVCNKLIANDLLTIFKQLYNIKYPIERISLIDDYNADDEQSMRANNTTCFNFRTIAGSQKLSKHSLGMAVDINPLYNPCVRHSRSNSGAISVEPSTARPYVNRKKSFHYKIKKDDPCYRLFIDHGFKWGGNWRTPKDYQHFER